MNGSADHRRTGAAPQPARQPWEAPPKVPALPWRTRWSIRLERARRWEFWPAWLYYLPIVAWILLLGLRHLRPTVFTAANSALDAGGVVGEHKFQALAPLQHNAPDLAAVCTRIAAGDGPLRHTAALRFAEVHGYPVVLKPDIGQRGRGVFIARNAAAVHDYLARFNGAVIAQQYIDGDEFGIFIARMPDQPQVQVLSIVHKTFPQVTGDGQRSLQQLILDDARVRLIADTLFARWAEDLQRVPDSGESIALVEIGAHCRGSLFLDATARVTPALVATLTQLADARVRLRPTRPARAQHRTSAARRRPAGAGAERRHRRERPHLSPRHAAAGGLCGHVPAVGAGVSRRCGACPRRRTGDRPGRTAAPLCHRPRACAAVVLSLLCPVCRPSRRPVWSTPMSVFDCCRPGAPRTRISRRLAALLMLFGSSMAVVAAPPVNTLKPGLFGASTTDTAIVGYDPVAYFTEGRPVPGSDAHVHTWKGAKWKFASAAHLEMFKAHPERYAPQYGGYCAYGVAKGDLVKIDPEAFAVIDGKLYLNYDSGIQKKWARDPQGYIKAADPKFPGLLEQ